MELIHQGVKALFLAIKAPSLEGVAWLNYRASLHSWLILGLASLETRAVLERKEGSTSTPDSPDDGRIP